jgi:cell division protein FtsI/penicillin-binding protein 2
MPDRLGPAELATTSFGQGVSANSLQIVRAVSAIANQGVMMRPTLVKEVYDPHTGEKINYEPQIVRRVVSADTAQTVTDMMVYAAPDRPEWVARNFAVAGKTGTSQIPSEDGGYKEEGTIASYVGFAPADDPQFVMLVKLTEPKASQWGATTAVPIWYDIANKVMMRL